MPAQPSQWDPVSKPISFVGRSGLDVSQPPEAIDDTASPSMKNVVFVQNLLQVDSGVKKFRQAVEGQPQGSFQFFLTNGASYTLLATTTTFYFDAPSADEWQYISDGNVTDVTTEVVAGGDILIVTSSASFTAGRRVGVLLDNGKQHRSIIEEITDGTHITLATPVPVGRSIAAGTQITQTLDLNGTTEFQVQGIPWSPNNWFIFSNGVDPVKYFDGVSLLDLPGLDVISLTSARVVQVFHGHLLLMDVTEGGNRLPQRVRRCDAGDPTEWVAGLAGNDDLVDTDDWILAANPLGPWMIITRENTFMRMSYIGDLLQLFFFEYTVSGSGGLCQSCVAETGSSLVVIGTAGALRYTGGFDSDYVGEQIFNLVFGAGGDLNTPFKDTAFTLYLSELDEVWFFYPSIGSELPDTLLRYNQGDESWFVRKLNKKYIGYGFFLSEQNVTWQSLVGSWQEQRFKWNSKVFSSNSPITLLCCPDDSQVYQYDYLSPSDDGEVIDFFWVSKDFLSPDKLLTLDSVTAFGRGNNILCEVSLDLGASWQTIGMFNFGLVSSRQQQHLTVTGPYLRFRFSGTDPLFQLSWFNPSYFENAEW